MGAKTDSAQTPSPRSLSVYRPTNQPDRLIDKPRDYVALAKGFPALALMSERDLSEDFGPFAAALEGALDPIVADFRRQMVSA